MEGYIKLAKLVEELGITRQTAHRWHKEGKLDYIKMGSTNWITGRPTTGTLSQLKRKESLSLVCVPLAYSWPKSNWLNHTLKWNERG